MCVGLAAVALAASIDLCGAQSRFWGGSGFWNDNSGPIVRTEGGQLVNEDTVRTARETAPHSVDWPAWTNAPGFQHDVFTFTRVLYKSRPGRPPWLGWLNDYPDGDLNLSFRLQQLTSLKVDPDGRVIRLTPKELADYPFIFISHPESMELGDEEVSALRNYLRNGGALLADDFWGTRDWEAFEAQMQRVLPGRPWVDLPMSHPLFHCVFDLGKSIRHLQVPTLQLWARTYDPADPGTVPSALRRGGEMRIRGWLDDKQRLMAIAIFNSDTGDGWEREGEDATYFQLFSEPRAYPLAINIIFYIMTH